MSTPGRYLLPLLLLLGTSVQAQEVVAVLSSELGPYREAYAGFEEELERRVPVVSLSAGEPRIGRQTRAVVAFGSKAAVEKYPDDVVLIYCMAPGASAEVERLRGKTVRVSMSPRPERLLKSLKEIQPSLERLGLFWMLDGFGEYADRLQEVAEESGMEIDAEQLEEVSELPEQLRRMAEREIDAVWLPPDPLLIDARSFSTLREFSRANDIPFYAPTSGFVSEGAVACVAVSFTQIGREAAALVRRVLNGDAVPAVVYPEECEISLNLQAAAQAGLQIADEVVDRASRVVP